MKPSKLQFAAFTILYCLVFCYVVRDRMGLDYLIYRQAALGNTDINLWGYGWIYADWISILWLPFASLPYKTGFMIWYAVIISSCVFISTKLTEVPYAYALLLVALILYSYSLRPGNIYPMLAAMSFSPWGILLAGLVKPQLLGLGAFLALGKGIQYYRRERIHQNH